MRSVQLIGHQDYLFAFRGHALLLAEQDVLPDAITSRAFSERIVRVIKAGEIDGRICHAIELPPDFEAPVGFELVGYRMLSHRITPKQLAMAARALELLEWERAHQFCGACGSPTRAAQDRLVRRCDNDACRREHYPKLSPVVIVAVERGAEILLGRSHHFPPGMYSTLAGFVDAGETAEEAVHREVFEETRIQIAKLRYFGSQPWPFPHSLMLGYHADYVGGEIVCAPDEIEDAAFFPADALPEALPGAGTIARWLINDFLRRNGKL